jgi:alpha-L-fucosidase
MICAMAVVAMACGTWAAEVSLRVPTRAATVVTSGRGAVEMDAVPGEVAFLVDGADAPAVLDDTVNLEYSSGARSGWPNEDETGVLYTQTPAGPGFHLTSGYLRCPQAGTAGAGDHWTFSAWVRADDGDWGSTIAKGNSQPSRLMRPVIAAWGDGTDPAWCVRLVRLRPQIVIGQWAALGNSLCEPGVWHHLAVIRDGAQVRLYLDGKADAASPMPPSGDPWNMQLPFSNTGPPPAADAPAIFRLGGYPFSLVHPSTTTRITFIGDKFIGALGGVSLVDRALTTEEIRAQFDAHRKDTETMRVRMSVLDDPTVGALARNPVQPEDTAAYRTRLAWFRDAKFGMFLHWGPSTLIKNEISWSRGSGKGQTPKEVYDNLYTQFNPTQYDPAAWAAQIKAAGMPYAVLITKHHDGFCEWPTKTNQYNIAYTPYGKDVVGPYVQAMRTAGIKVGLYFSGPDWWHEDYKKQEIPLADYRNAQLRELLGNYGPIDLLWFDSGGGLFPGVRQLQPAMLINDRCGAQVDYVTPENYMADRPMLNPNGSDQLWETCSGTGGYWGYASAQPYLTSAQVIRHLVEVVAKGGNWLCNVAPRETGELPATHMAMLKEVGDWLKVNGAGVYGTHRTHLGRQMWGWTTANGTTLFLHVLDNTEVLRVPLYDTATGARLLRGNTPVPFTQRDGVLAVTLPTDGRDPVDTVVAVTVKRAEHPAITKGHFMDRALGGEATASLAYDVQTAAVAFDGKRGSKWFTATAPTGWLQYRFANGAAWAVSRYRITSAGDVQERDPKDWQLQGSWDGAAWVTLDTRTNQDFASRLETHIYDCANTTAYPYYRLLITANHGAPGLQLDELRLQTYE